ncbi:MAG: chemotaxis protein CheW [Geoalkalibacter sp.]|jgi:purine-binding chemotaxis protein CheW|uniref:chemotaxis protein CheW n=1 Tax=Geoalkalibacter sp. TaxID=3041440 RepID=UPI003D1462BE
MQGEEEKTDGLLITGFRLGAASFGVDARMVLEVVKVGELTRVHDAPLGIVGIRNLRGRIVTVIDMAIHLDLGCVVNGPEARLLIMDHRGETYGFLVDAVTEAIVLEEDRIAPPPASMDPTLRSRLRGGWREADRITAILDPQALFQWEETIQK